MATTEAACISESEFVGVDGRAAGGSSRWLEV